MNPTAALSQQRLARLTAWARLWLQAAAAVLLVAAAADPSGAWRALKRMARIVAQIVSQRAAPRRGALLRRAAWYAPVDRAALTRSFLGARVRKRLRGRDPIGLFFAILRVMADIDAIIARQSKRLARGLTRLCPIPLAREFTHDDAHAPAPEVTLADSS